MTEVIVVNNPEIQVVTQIEESIQVIAEQVENIQVITEGIQGPQGPTGATGAGVPSGGSTGQVLTKASNANYDTQWQAIGGVTSLNGLAGDLSITSPDASVSILASGLSIALQVASGGGGLTWNEVTTSTQALAVSNGYVMNNASQVVGTLPSTASFGAVVRVAGKGAGGWKIAQNSGQTIHFDGNNTTTGVTGFLASQNTFDCVELLCITANTDFLVTSSIGNITGA